MNVSGQDISIEIGASADSAIKKINDLATALQKLKGSVDFKFKFEGLPTADRLNKTSEAMKKFAEISESIKKGADGINSFGNALQSLATVRVPTKSLQNLSDGLVALAEAVSHILPENVERIERLCNAVGQLKGVSVRGLATELKNMSDTNTPAYNPSARLKDFKFTIPWMKPKDAIGGLADALGGITNLANKAGDAMLGFGKKVTTAMGAFLKGQITSKIQPLVNLFGQIKRIAISRVIREAIKKVIEGFKEGLEYAYKFSASITTEGHRFSVAMDKISSAGYKMKAQLGSAFISLLTAIEPILNQIIELVTRVADSLAQLFAAFTGGTYLKASNVTSKYADTMKKGASSAKEWKNQILGFDEINRLNAPSGGSSGTNKEEVDPTTAYKDSPISKRIKEFVDTVKQLYNLGFWRTLGKYIGSKVNSLFPTTAQWMELGQKFGSGVQSVITTGLSFLDTVEWKAHGSNLATFINSFIGEINFNDLGRLIIRRLTSVFDFVMGFLGTLNWKDIGTAIGGFLRGAFDEATEWLESQDWETIGENVYTKFKELLEGLDFDSLAESFFRFLGTALGAGVRVLWEFLEGVVGDIVEEFNKNIVDYDGDGKIGLADFLKGVWKTGQTATNWIKTNIVDPLFGGFATGMDTSTKKFTWEEFLTWLGMPTEEEWKELGKKWADGIKTGFEDFWNDVCLIFFNKTWEDLVEDTNEFFQINSPSKKFSKIGSGLAEGIQTGFSKKWDEFDTWISGKWDELERWWNNRSLPQWSIKLPHFNVYWENLGASNAVANLLGFTSIPRISVSWYANGGFPEDGLFMANHGELVGQFSNGKTAVANNEQIVEGIERGVYNAMMSALANNDSGGSDRPIELVLDGRILAEGLYPYNKAVANRHGGTLIGGVA